MSNKRSNSSVSRHHASRSDSPGASSNGRNITLTLDECHSRVQSVSEQLLIPCTPRPVFTSHDELALTPSNFESFRDRLVGQLNKTLILSQDVSTQSQTKQVAWNSLCQCVKELTSVVLSLLELSAHISYLIAVRAGEGQGGAPAVLGPVASAHQLHQAHLDIRFSCQRLKRSRVSDLQSQLLMELCSSLTKSLSVMTEVCRHASQVVHDSTDQDQFKLCVKAITSAISCLVTSIKSFRRSPSDLLLQRVVTFCDPVISTSEAVLAFATEVGFIGHPAQLTQPAMDVYKTALGPTVNMASAIIQMFRAVRDMVHPSSSFKRHQDRVSLCVESLTRSSAHLRDIFLTHAFIPLAVHSTHLSSHSGTFDPNNHSTSLSVKDGSMVDTGSSYSRELQHAKDDNLSTTGSPYLDSVESITTSSQPEESKVRHKGQSSPLQLTKASSETSSRDSTHHHHHRSKHSHSLSASLGSKSPRSSRKQTDNDGTSRSPKTKERRHKSSSSSSESSSKSSHKTQQRNDQQTKAVVQDTAHTELKLDTNSIAANFVDGTANIGASQHGSPQGRNKSSSSVSSPSSPPRITSGERSSDLSTSFPQLSPNNSLLSGVVGTDSSVPVPQESYEMLDLGTATLQSMAVTQSHDSSSSRPASVDVELVLSSLENVGPDFDTSYSSLTIGDSEAYTIGESLREPLPGLGQLNLRDHHPSGSDEEGSCHL